MKRMVLAILVGALVGGLTGLSRKLDDCPSVASHDELRWLKGGARCYYPNPVTCANALPEQDCEDWCVWRDDVYGYDVPDDPWDDPFWGWFGRWECPDFDQDVKINELETTQKTADRLDDGWNADAEKEDEEPCNTIYNCSCWPASSPKTQGPGAFSVCLTKDPPLVSPMSTFREVIGDQDCEPDGV